MKNNIPYALATAFLMTLGMISVVAGLFVLATRSWIYTPYYLIGIKIVIKGLREIEQALSAIFKDPDDYISIDFDE